MNESNNISDQDRQLARKFGERLSGSHTPEELDNPLIESLTSFKKNELAIQSDDIYSRKNNSWNQIEKTIGQFPRRNETFFYRMGAVKHWGKIAAVIAISAILSIYFFQFQNMQQPLASAGSTMITVTLSDGSTVTLRPHSTLFENQISAEQQSYKLDGEAYFSVLKNQNREFIVNTEDGSVEVLGTEFNVRTWDNSTDVYLESGSLRFSSVVNKDMNVLLSPGQFSSITKGEPLSTPQQAEEEQFTSWKNNEIIFTNRRATSIFSELEHHYSITIVAPNDVNSELLGGSISLESADQSLQNLGTVLGGRFLQTGTNTYEFIASE
jgi:ferric-dicitrate binding protein FerR (iron transport regulator)